MKDRTLRIISGALGLSTFIIYILLVLLFVPSDVAKFWFVIIIFIYTAVRNPKLWDVVCKWLRDKDDEEIDPLDYLDMEDDE